MQRLATCALDMPRIQGGLMRIISTRNRASPVRTRYAAKTIPPRFIPRPTFAPNFHSTRQSRTTRQIHKAVRGERARSSARHRSESSCPRAAKLVYRNRHRPIADSRCVRCRIRKRQPGNMHPETLASATVRASRDTPCCESADESAEPRKSVARKKQAKGSAKKSAGDSNKW